MWRAPDDGRPPNEGPEQARPERSMTRAEAGKKGGLTTKRRYGQGFYRQIGRLGGKKGGESTKQRYGVGFYRDIAKKSRTKED